MARSQKQQDATAAMLKARAHGIRLRAIATGKKITPPATPAEKREALATFNTDGSRKDAATPPATPPATRTRKVATRTVAAPPATPPAKAARKPRTPKATPPATLNSEPFQLGDNIIGQVVNGQLIMSVDLSRELGVSNSGKSTKIAAAFWPTFDEIPGMAGVKMNVTVVRSIPKNQR